MPMTFASQRVSGKVSSIKIRKIVSGAAKNAPGPPSNHAQKMNPKKRTVGEMLKPRPMSIGESAFSASMLMTITPAMTSNALVRPCSAKARTTAGATARGSPIQGMKLRKKARTPHIRGKSTLKTSSKMVTPAAVTRLTMARSPSWRMTLWPKTANRSTCGWSVARAGAQPIHHGRPLSEQEQHDDQDQKEVAQEVGDAGEDGADSPCEGAGTERFVQVGFGDPRLLVRLWMLSNCRSASLV